MSHSRVAKLQDTWLPVDTAADIVVEPQAFDPLQSHMVKRFDRFCIPALDCLSSSRNIDAYENSSC